MNSATPQTVANQHGKLRRFNGPVMIAIATLIMLIWSWETWPDPLVDFGAQLYVPWQISTGHVLYRDIAYYNGPLSSYVNAGAFRLFGVGIRTLVWVNLAILIAGMTLAYHLTVRASGRLAATMGGLTFVLIFAFGQVVRMGNYNWLTPYTHEITHGTVLGLAAIACVIRYQHTQRLRSIAAAGFLLGAVFLTKAEPTAASFAAVAILLLGGGWVAREQRSKLFRAAAVLVGCTIVIPLLACMLLATAMPASAALRGVLGSWPWAFDRRITSLHFYRGVSGLDDIRHNLLVMLNWTGVYAALIATGIMAGLFCRTRRNRLAMTIIAFLACSAVFIWRFTQTEWAGMLTPLPICLSIAFAVTAIAVLLRSNKAAPLRLALVVFATVLVAKMGLRPYAFHYGFVLAWPATVVLICWVVQDLPAWIERHGATGSILRAIGLAAWLAAVAAMLRIDALRFDEKQAVVAQATPDEFRGDGRAAAVWDLCQRISRVVPPNGTMIVLPQGLMINYLTHRATPTKFVNFMPPEVLTAGEANILSALKRHPPDVIVMTPAVIKNGFFTLDDRDPYGAATYEWVMQNYQPADAAEAEKLRSNKALVMMVPRLRPGH
jgi:hypothetical protein